MTKRMIILSFQAFFLVLLFLGNSYGITSQVTGNNFKAVDNNDQSLTEIQVEASNGSKDSLDNFPPAIEEVIVEIDGILSSAGKEAVKELQLEELQNELGRIIKENYDDDELKRELEKLRDDLTGLAGQLEKEVNDIDTSKVEEELSKTWEDLKGNVNSFYDKVKYQIQNRKNRRVLENQVREGNVQEMKAKYLTSLQRFDRKVKEMTLSSVKLEKETLNNYGRNLRQNDSRKKGREAPLPTSDYMTTKMGVLGDVSSKKSLYPSYYNSNDPNALWTDEEYDIVKEYRELLGFRLIGSALHDAAYATSQRRRQNGINRIKDDRIDQVSSMKAYSSTNIDSSMNIDDYDKNRLSPRERLNAYIAAKLKEAFFLELEKRATDGGFSEAELQHIITNISSCLPSSDSTSDLGVGSMLSSFLHADVSNNDNMLKDISEGKSPEKEEVSLDLSSSDMIRMVKILLPQDVKESLAKLEIQLVKVGLIELPADSEGNVNENPTPEEIETAILIALKQLSILSLKLKQINLAEAIDDATDLLARIQMMKEANPNAQEISFNPDMSKWEILVQLDELKEANKAYYGPDVPFGSRSFEVELRNSSILIAVGEMKVQNEPNGLPPFKSEELAQNYFDIIYDNSLDLDELKYLSKQFFALGEVYELTDIGRLMLAIQDYYGVTSFDQINNKSSVNTDYAI